MRDLQGKELVVVTVASVKGLGIATEREVGGAIVVLIDRKRGVATAMREIVVGVPIVVIDREVDMTTLGHTQLAPMP